jgi:hypothetical protein
MHENLRSSSANADGGGRLNEDTRRGADGEEDEKLSCLFLGAHSQKVLLGTHSQKSQKSVP